MHGILGSMSNWNTPAKQLLQQIGPRGWRVLQLDHRAHGKSGVGEPPHTIEACADDVLETLRAAGVRLEEDELVLCGHSFGGKVALAVARARLEEGLPPPKMTWLFDSVPGCPVEQDAEQQRAEQSVSFVLGAVEQVSTRGPFPDRASLVDALVEYGLSKPLGQWVAQSVRNVDDGVELAYDVKAIRALYDAYRTTDLWDILEGGRAEVGVVVAGKNKHAWGSENLQRLRQCEPGLRVVTLSGAGHNVHVDDLPGLLTALKPTFD